MKKKPLIIIILGIIHILEPLTKILFLKISTGFSFEVVLDNVFAINGIRSFFEFWMLFPIGGIALLSVKNWSYPVFVAVQIYSLIAHLTYEEYTWPYVQETPILSSIVLVIFNIGMIIYFLIPQTRKPFLDKGVRWWESKQRFAVKIPCKVEGVYTNLNESSQILNISLTGAFIKGLKHINVNDEILLKFDHFDIPFTVKAVVKSYHEFGGEAGWGIEFVYNDWKERFRLNKLLKMLKISKSDALDR